MTATDSYTVLRGTLAALSLTDYGSPIASGLIGTVVADSDSPGVNEGFNYVVAGDSAACGSGPLGRAAGGLPRSDADLP